MSQLHKRFNTEQVKELFEKYLNDDIERNFIQDILGIKKAMFFKLLKKYKDNPKNFSIDYKRKTSKRISDDVEKIILDELEIDKGIIHDKNNPTTWYNYSYIKTRLENNYNHKVSLPSIIKRAKENDFYIKKKAKKNLMTAKS